MLNVGRLGRQVGAQASKIGTRAARRPWSRVFAMATAFVVIATGAGTPSLTQAGTTNHPSNGASIGRAAMGILSVTPASGTDSPLPSGTPKAPSGWQSADDTMPLAPAVPLSPSTRITVPVPAGPAGVRSATGGLLAQPGAAPFSTEAFSVRRLSELLAELGYLPMSRQEQDLGRQVSQPVDLIGFRLANQVALADRPPPGTFTTDRDYPASLTSMWHPDTFNVILQGAVMAFESEHRMPVNGVVDLALWDALSRAEAAGADNRNGYTYAIVNKRRPETLTIWHGGRIVLRSLANTGIPISPTVDGTFPVYLRYRSQIMRGTNPNGTRYADRVSFVSYFHGSDAVHSFWRRSYGYPQSLGCVELPYSDAKRAWPYLTDGTLVTVKG